MRVTLTFDNGPDVVGTPMALDALAERGITAVFFVVGSKAAQHPELLQRMAAAGHVLGNHTWSHSGSFGEIGAGGNARDEIFGAETALTGLASEPPLFRPVGSAPGGVLDDRLFTTEAVDALIDGGFTAVLWNVVPRDWERPHDWNQGVTQACRDAEHAVLVLHDGHPAGMPLLPQVLDELLEAGTEFRTDFPDDCVPIRAGEVTPALQQLTHQLREERP